MGLSGKWIDKVHQRRPLKDLILDMDSSVSETYGQQEGSTYNGHFGCMCFHPAILDRIARLALPPLVVAGRPE